MKSLIKIDVCPIAFTRPPQVWARLLAEAFPNRGHLATDSGYWVRGGVAKDTGQDPTFIYISEMFAAVAPVQTFRPHPVGRKIVIFKEDWVARAASLKGTSTNQLSFVLIDTSWARAARFHITLWMVGVPPEVNPADAPQEASRQGW